VIPTDDLLPLLHDGDQGVRTVCEKALRSRGLQGPYVQLARQMSDPQPTVRAQVPAQLQQFPDLDAKLWLERMIQDESPAVRAAVLRMAAELDDLPFRDRLLEMADTDPCPTIRQIGHFYLTRQQRPTD
jgi:hypothetical protein